MQPVVGSNEWRSSSCPPPEKVLDSDFSPPPDEPHSKRLKKSLSHLILSKPETFFTLFGQLDEWAQYYEIHLLGSHERSDAQLKRQFSKLIQLTQCDRFYKACGGVYGDTHTDHLPKNRYPDTFPYALNRVILNGNRDQTDYINASWVRHEKRTYIATQAPLARDSTETIDDFWNMIWNSHSVPSEAGVGQIIMLTDEAQAGQAIQYWPDEIDDEESYGEITVSITREKVHSDGYILRRLKLTKGEQTKVVHHWQFPHWPDKSVPTVDAFVKFHHLVETDRLKHFPTQVQVVHCSAGIGRTGVYIAWNSLLAQISNQATVNLFKTLVDLRKQRMNMVSSLIQYKFLHKLVVHALQKTNSKSEE